MEESLHRFETLLVATELEPAATVGLFDWSPDPNDNRDDDNNDARLECANMTDNENIAMATVSVAPGQCVSLCDCSLVGYCSTLHI